MSHKVILWIIVLVAGIGLIISANIFQDKFLSNPTSQTTPTPSSSESPSLTPAPSPSSSPKSSANIAATCQLSGEIRFISKDLYETIGAKIVYQNVDDKIRQIYWKSNPADGTLTVGPNLFENLAIPNGQSDVGVALVKKSTIKTYTLTASITYGIKRADGFVEEREAQCSGSTKVTMP